MTLLHVTSTGPVFLRGADERRFPAGPGETHDLPVDLNERAIASGAVTIVDEIPEPPAESPEDPAMHAEPEEPLEDSTATATTDPDAATTETPEPDAESITSADTTKSSKPRAPRKEQ